MEYDISLTESNAPVHVFTTRDKPAIDTEPLKMHEISEGLNTPNLPYGYEILTFCWMDWRPVNICGRIYVQQVL